MRVWQVFSTRWCARTSFARTSIIANRIRCASSTRLSAWNCGRKTRFAISGGALLTEAQADPTGLAVDLSGVTKIFDNGVAALGPIDLQVRKGEFVSLLGPSGCGKSTALRLIAGLSAPTSGALRVSHSSAAASGVHPVGFVFQEPTLMPWANVRENIRLPLKLAHVPAGEAKSHIEAALAQVGLAEFA